ncbi:UNVERIFIED_CONTAM: General transcription and DNA repair factor IIH subunit TFB1-1 [Sesamum latifolium]|uniref:General transcription and DNA repair factor IIH subunit TFB1-1 n=1 Tax=Sesamum latifolium TaxID=2727402 RepID=A0AAW2TQ21_9LAMI
MADKQVIKRAKYKSSVKDPGVAGVLKMSIERFVFMPNDPKSTTKLNVDFRMIKGHKFTKEGSSKQALLNLTQDQGGNYIFEFDSFADRDVCREFVVCLVKKEKSGYAVSSDSLIPMLYHAFELADFMPGSVAVQNVCFMLALHTPNAIAFHAEAGRVVPDKSAPPVNNEQLSREETERRIKLLQENSELQTLHKQFVYGGILTEAEFWATRKFPSAST